MSHHLAADIFGQIVKLSTPRPPHPPTAPITREQRIEWARAAVMAGAKAWSEAIAMPGNAGQDHICRARDDVALLKTTVREALLLFADKLDGDHKSIENYLSDLFVDGFEWPLEKWLEDLEADYEDLNDEHRTGRFEALGR